MNMGDLMICNVHLRTLPVPADVAGALLDRVAEPGNPVWPAPDWPALVLDRPLADGADGGHGRNRYTCTNYQPGRRVEFTFGPESPFVGTHAFDVLKSGSNACVLRHAVIATPRDLRGRLQWSLIIRWSHDAMIEDLLDRMAVAVGHPPVRPARWSPYVRLLRRALGRWKQNQVESAQAR